jgi:hypothetical protein
MVLIPASTSCFALAGPIPDTQVRRLIVVLVSSSRILEKLNTKKKIHCHGKNILRPRSEVCSSLNKVRTNFGNTDKPVDGPSEDRHEKERNDEFETREK